MRSKYEENATDWPWVPRSCREARCRSRLGSHRRHDSTTARFVPASFAPSILLIAILLGGCSDDTTDCTSTRSCNAVETTGGGAGTAATGGTGNAGLGSGGATDGGAGMAGVAGTGSAGSGAEGSVAEPCHGACGRGTVCNKATNQCVECTEDAHCSANTPVCDPATDRCVECTKNANCAAASPFCNVAQNTCAECLESPNCSKPSASRCEAGACAPCQTNADCAHVAGKTVCDAGECVQCTGKDYATCTDPVSGRPFVCDSLSRTCSTQQTHSAGLCAPCVSDAACPLGQLCVLQRFGEQYGKPTKDVGYFCFAKQGDVANGGPADCPDIPPYVDTLEYSVSIDRQASTICGLRTSTCPARHQVLSKDCGRQGNPDNSLCGFDPPNDAVCTQIGPTAFRCTTTCGSDIDCVPGMTCNIGALLPYCQLPP